MGEKQQLGLERDAKQPASDSLQARIDTVESLFPDWEALLGMEYAFKDTFGDSLMSKDLSSFLLPRMSEEGPGGGGLTPGSGALAPEGGKGEQLPSYFELSMLCPELREQVLFLLLPLV